jgi:DnaJ-domain-containing protein 1
MVLQLPGRLDRTTLGDVLGALHRYGVSGTLKLLQATASGRIEHSIAWHEGLIHDVTCSRGPRSADSALQSQSTTARLERLNALFALDGLQLRFEVMHPARRHGRPLLPAEFLSGRPRWRDRLDTEATRDSSPQAAAPRWAASATSSPSGPLSSPSLAWARHLLGVAPHASPATLRAAFRRCAGRWHPDRSNLGDAGAAREAHQRFLRVVAAYEQLSQAAAQAY